MRASGHSGGQSRDDPLGPPWPRIGSGRSRPASASRNSCLFAGLDLEMRDIQFEISRGIVGQPITAEGFAVKKHSANQSVSRISADEKM